MGRFDCTDDEELEEEETDGYSDEGSPQRDDEKKLTGDVRADLEHILTSRNLDWNFAFAFQQAYPDAPNPVLRLADLGTIGLPVNAREAEAIKSRAVQAPFGMGERTVVDKTVRDTWEMDSKQVTFGSPRWDEFLQRAVQDVCKALNVNYKTNRPRCELHKLLLYETGSHFLPHVDTEKADGMFATMIIILPSEYTGGSAHLSHSGLSIEYDCSATCLDQTVVLAWYTDVKHEIKPVTSGYRLALSYNLIHTTQAPRPALALDPTISTRLSTVLATWQGAKGRRAPQKILYFLNHSYSHANFHAGALKGADAQKAAILASLAPQHEFALGLANVSCRLAGAADDEYGRGRGDVDFGEIQDSDITVEHFVDMAGNLLAPLLEFDEESETVPAELMDEIGRGPCEKENYEAYTGNEAGSLERWYRRSVLVIWPERNRAAMLHGGKAGFARAAAAVENSSSKKPSPAERTLIDVLLCHEYGDDAQVARLCAQAALKWKDVELWRKVVEHYAPKRGVDVLPIDMYLEAAKVLGFKHVKAAFERVLCADNRNTPRFNFLTAIEVWMSTRPPALRKKASKEVKPWLTIQRKVAVASLTKPDQSECTVLVSAARQLGGMEYLKDHMIPQLLSISDCSFLVKFARAIHEEASFEQPSKDELTRTLLATAIKRTTFYPPLELKDKSARYDMAQCCALAPSYAEACVQIGHIDLANTIFTHFTGIATSHPKRKLTVQGFAADAMLPLVTVVLQGEDTMSKCMNTPEFLELRRTTVKLCMDYLVTTSYAVRRELVRQLAEAIAPRDKSADLLISFVIPALKSTSWPDLQSRVVVDEFRRVAHRSSYPDDYKDHTLGRCLVTIADKYLKGVQLHDVDTIIAELTWGAGVNQKLAQRVLNRVFTAGPWASAHITGIFLPLVPKLRAWAVQSDQLDALAIPFQKIVGSWADTIFGPPPSLPGAQLTELDSLQRWTCTCTNCVRVRRFIDRDTSQSDYFRHTPAAETAHVVEEVKKYASHLVKCDTWNVMDPCRLRVDKSDTIRTYSVWNVNRYQGRQMLRDMSSDDQDLRRLLGDQYAKIATVLAAKPAVSAQPVVFPTAASVYKRRADEGYHFGPRKKRRR
ncbi:2OG-Fe(II) oxygenase [Phanerochaete sordida]|uniref:2OG-Fe(II) oxygenase n=1 Tax=Phanerochaete sordida TaxID=48140 RepID=A0A9P3LAB6_9APHY|nr:2OG-Fe(II) oxygenase [Phanerochaete sordida]